MVCERRLPNVFVLFRSYENLEYIEGIAGGTTFAEVSKKAFRPIPVLVPPADIVNAFDDLVRPIYLQIVSNTRETKTLAQTRDLFLPKLMSGKIRLRDAETVVEAVT